MKVFCLTGLAAVVIIWEVWRGYGKTQWGCFSDFMEGEGAIGLVLIWGVLWLLFSRLA